jgi:hypothetical protein
MIYTLANGQTIDTAADLTFDERNFIQKMLIYSHLKMSIDEFRNRWRNPGNPVWKGPSTTENPTAAVKILLDLEKKLKQ